MLSAAIPQQLRLPGFGCGSEFAESFPGRKTLCDQGQARGARPSGTFRRTGSVLGVTATCHPLGFLLGMERLTGEEAQDPGAGHELLHSLAPGLALPSIKTGPQHKPRPLYSGETEAKLEGGPGSNPVDFPAPSCWVDARSCHQVWCGFAGLKGQQVPGDHEPSLPHSPGSAALCIQPHPRATSSQDADQIQDWDEHPFSLSYLGELLFAFIFVASSMSPLGHQHHRGGCQGHGICSPPFLAGMELLSCFKGKLRQGTKRMWEKKGGLILVITVMIGVVNCYWN